MREQGLSATYYLSPLSSEHAIDDYYGDQQQYLDATAEEVRLAKEKENAEREAGE